MSETPGISSVEACASCRHPVQAHSITGCLVGWGVADLHPLCLCPVIWNPQVD